MLFRGPKAMPFRSLKKVKAVAGRTAGSERKKLQIYL